MYTCIETTVINICLEKGLLYYIIAIILLPGAYEFLRRKEHESNKFNYAGNL